MFTPGNWHHQVYNLEPTVAITENFINHTNYEVVEEHLHKVKDQAAIDMLVHLKDHFLDNGVLKNMDCQYLERVFQNGMGIHILYYLRGLFIQFGFMIKRYFWGSSMENAI